jgi:hypothetical protein
MTIGHRFLTQILEEGILISTLVREGLIKLEITPSPMREPKAISEGTIVNETFTFKHKCWCPEFASHIEITFCLQTFPFLPMYRAS